MSSQHDIFTDMFILWQRERAETQMTLWRLIAALELMPRDAKIANLHSAHSYRGYYCDLAFERGVGTRQASDLLVECKNAVNRVFCGYKGGDYQMNLDTPVWVADYGCFGQRLMALQECGAIETENDPVVD